jgi:agmatinase
LPFGNVEESLEIIERSSAEILNDGKFPVFIGGEHLISLPVIRKVYEKYGKELMVLHFDAHADLREDYLGCRYSHASVIRRLVEFIPPGNVFQFGIRSGTKDEFEFADKNTNMYRYDVLEPLKKAKEIFRNNPVYVTLDIDVVDPAFASGTGTPEPGGVGSREILEVIGLLSGIKLVGFDIVEVSPPYDISDRTALLAAKIIREFILTAG